MRATTRVCVTLTFLFFRPTRYCCPLERARVACRLRWPCVDLCYYVTLGIFLRKSSKLLLKSILCHVLSFFQHVFFFPNLFHPFYPCISLFFCKMYWSKVLFAKLLVRRCFLWMTHSHYLISHNVYCVFTPLSPWHCNLHSFSIFLNTQLAQVAQSSFLHLQANLSWWAITSAILILFENPSVFIQFLEQWQLDVHQEVIDSLWMFFHHTHFWYKL